MSVFDAVAADSVSGAKFAASLLFGWAADEAYLMHNLVRDGNGALVTADVVWPDGAPGNYVTDVASSTFLGRVDGWHVTYQRPNTSITYTFSQPRVTRDGQGNITVQPDFTCNPPLSTTPLNQIPTVENNNVISSVQGVGPGANGDIDLTGAVLLPSNNLSDVVDPAQALTNLGAGSAAGRPSSDFAPASLVSRVSNLEADLATGAQIASLTNRMTQLEADALTIDDLLVSTQLGTTPSNVSFPLLIAPYGVKVKSLSIVCALAVAQSASNYWTMRLRRYRAGVATTIAQKYTATNAVQPNSEAISAFTDWNFNSIAFDASGSVLQQGDAVVLQCITTGSPAALTSMGATLRYEPT